MNDLIARLKNYIPFFDTYLPEDGDLSSAHIADGSYGRVFCVYHESMPDAKAALKVVTTKNITKYQGLNEIVMMNRLRNYQNIVRYLNFKVHPITGQEDQDILILMELLEPLNFKLMMETSPTLEPEIIKLGIDLCNALIVLNTNHIIHRDIKPANIFYSKELGCYKLGDFGIAKENQALSPSTQKGTALYASPETYFGVAEIAPGDSRCDLYSLGIVMYQLANENRLPFMPQKPTSTDFEEAVKRRLVKGEPLPDLPEYITSGLSQIIKRATAYKRENGYSDPQVMLSDLQSLTVAPPLPQPVPQPKDMPEPTVKGDDKASLYLKITFENKDESTTVRKFPCVVGRSSKADVIVQDIYVGARHCAFSLFSEHIFAITDLNSLNKTILNGKVLTPSIEYPLKSGDLINIGNTTISVL